MTPSPVSLIGIMRFVARILFIGLCALVLAGLTASATMLVHSTVAGLHRILVDLRQDVASDSVVLDVTTAGGLGVDVKAQPVIPGDYIAGPSFLNRVQQEASMVYLDALTNIVFYSLVDTPLAVYDPLTDSTIQPWVMHRVNDALKQIQTVLVPGSHNAGYIN